MTLNKEQCENLRQFCRTQWQDMMTDEQEKWLTDGLIDFVAKCATDIGLDWQKIPQNVAEEICKECYDYYQQTDCTTMFVRNCTELWTNLPGYAKYNWFIKGAAKFIDHCEALFSYQATDEERDNIYVNITPYSVA